MPNIEIHGMVYESYTHDRAPAYDLYAEIFELFKDKPYVNEMVITVCHDDVSNRKNSQPFLRLVSTPQSFINEILEILKTLKMDIEYLQLTAFFPKEE